MGRYLWRWWGEELLMSAQSALSIYEYFEFIKMPLIEIDFYNGQFDSTLNCKVLVGGQLPSIQWRRFGVSNGILMLFFIVYNFDL